MNTITAKMKCNSVLSDQYDQETATLTAVYGDSTGKFPENESYSKAIPSAQLSITISNPGAKGFFKPGANYVLTFNEAVGDGVVAQFQN